MQQKVISICWKVSKVSIIELGGCRNWNSLLVTSVCSVLLSLNIIETITFAACKNDSLVPVGAAFWGFIFLLCFQCTRHSIEISDIYRYLSDFFFSILCHVSFLNLFSKCWPPSTLLSLRYISSSVRQCTEVSLCLCEIEHTFLSIDGIR